MALDTAEEMTLSPIDFATTPITGFPLQGIKIVIIHVKDSLTDGPDVGETILNQLEEYERAVGLG
ncbi:MAG: 3',5'-cyclic-nucleotide phosphodiesterase pde1, partial [Pleopsidium flavum]